MYNPLVEIKDIHKSFGPLEVLKGVDFSVNQGEVVCLIGKSGSGKSTLLRCINLLETPDSGMIHVFGEDVLSIKDVNQFRKRVGMCFQQFNLFANYSVIDNCIMPQLKVLKNLQMQMSEDYPEDKNNVSQLLVHYVCNQKSCCLMNLLPHWTQKW